MLPINSISEIYISFRQKEKKMNYTKHAQKRMQQRAISEDVVLLALKEGKPLTRERFLLTKEILDTLKNKNLYSKELLRKAAKQVPLIVVFNSTTIISIFHAYKKNLKRSGNKRKHHKRHYRHY